MLAMFKKCCESQLAFNFSGVEPRKQEVRVDQSGCRERVITWTVLKLPNDDLSFFPLFFSAESVHKQGDVEDIRNFQERLNHNLVKVTERLEKYTATSIKAAEKLTCLCHERTESESQNEQARLFHSHG